VNCREAERLIDTFFDGELDGRSMRDAAMHITRCKRCETELNDREQLQKVLAATIDDEIADVDLSRIWAAVEPTLDQAPYGLRWGEGLRLAATTSRVGGLVLGRRGPVSEADLAAIDPAQWDADDERRGRSWRWSLAGGTALAASVLLAIALLPGTGGDGERASRPTSEVARVAEQPATAVAQRPAVAPPRGEAPFALASTDARGSRSASKQVQVESVNFPRSSVAMWSEPTSDTTVIWIEDEELAAGAR